PVARSDAQMAYYPGNGGQLLLFSGNSGGIGVGDTWNWDGTNWNQLSPPTSPPPTMNATLDYDPTNNALILFGGYKLDGTGDSADTWKWDGTTWTQLALAPAPNPGRRDAPGSAFDIKHNILVVYGGQHAGTIGDTWTWDGATWSQAYGVPYPSPR